MAKKKNLVPEELDDLIQEYLTDGVLTDKERSVILRKAAGMGLDTEEIDLYLEAQVQKIQQAADAVTRQRKGKTCPYCGASVPQLTEKCPYCDQYITPEIEKKLQGILDTLEDSLESLKSTKIYTEYGFDFNSTKATIERNMRKARMYYGSNPKVQKLLAEINQETIIAERKIKSVLRIKRFFSPGRILLIIYILFLLFFIYKGITSSGEDAAAWWAGCFCFAGWGPILYYTIKFWVNKIKNDL